MGLSSIFQEEYMWCQNGNGVSVKCIPFRDDIAVILKMV